MVMAGECILVVDDAKDIREFIINYVLKPNGYRWLEAEDGLEAYELILLHTPDLVVTDLKMPRMDGLGLIRRLHKEGIGLPIVLMTFYGSEEIAIEVFRMRVRDYIVKPFTVDELLASIELALREVRLRQEHEKLNEQMVVANRDLERRIYELEALFDVGRILTSLPSYNNLLLYIIQTAMHLMRSREARLLMLSEDGRDLVVRAEQIGEDEGRLVSKQVKNPLAWASINAEKVLYSDPYRDGESQRNTMQICAPLIIGSNAIGVLSVNLAPGETDQHQLNLLATLADYAAIGIEQARLLALLNA
jgi:DNA-binding response OmpR family regulator